MDRPCEKSDVNSNGGAPQPGDHSTNHLSQSQEQAPNETSRQPPPNTERGSGDSVNQVDKELRKAEPPLYRHHPPPAQQNSAPLRKQL